MDNVKVVVRIRPDISQDGSVIDSEAGTWTVDGNAISLGAMESKGLPVYNGIHQYSFDAVFTGEASTAQIYALSSKDIIESCCRGINGTIFTYGQTSSGKTYTMSGNKSSPGIIPLAIEDVFKFIKHDFSVKYIVKISYLEIYNEVVNDLLKVGNTNLKIHQHLTRGIYVGNLTEVEVSDSQQVYALITKGEENRHVGATNMNERSSRSHTILQIVIESQHISAVRVSCLNLVDLAGSERASQTGAEGKRLKEGGLINKSLLALATVIGKLSDEGSDRRHIPFRNSKITRILQPSLGGNARTLIICTITPFHAFVDETISTLKFASRAKSIRNKPTVNEIIPDDVLIKHYKEEISHLKSKLKMQETMCEKDEASDDLIFSSQLSFAEELELRRDTSSTEVIRAEDSTAETLAHDVSNLKLYIQSIRSLSKSSTGICLRFRSVWHEVQKKIRNILRIVAHSKIHVDDEIYLKAPFEARLIQELEKEQLSIKVTSLTKTMDDAKQKVVSALLAVKDKFELEHKDIEPLVVSLTNLFSDPESWCVPTFVQILAGIIEEKTVYNVLVSEYHECRTLLIDESEDKSALISELQAKLESNIEEMKSVREAHEKLEQEISALRDHQAKLTIQLKDAKDLNSSMSSTISVQKKDSNFEDATAAPNATRAEAFASELAKLLVIPQSCVEDFKSKFLCLAGSSIKDPGLFAGFVNLWIPNERVTGNIELPKAVLTYGGNVPEPLNSADSSELDLRCAETEETIQGLKQKLAISESQLLSAKNSLRDALQSVDSMNQKSKADNENYTKEISSYICLLKYIVDAMRSSFAFSETESKTLVKSIEILLDTQQSENLELAQSDIERIFKEKVDNIKTMFEGQLSTIRAKAQSRIDEMEIKLFQKENIYQRATTEKLEAIRLADELQVTASQLDEEKASLIANLNRQINRIKKLEDNEIDFHRQLSIEQRLRKEAEEKCLQLQTRCKQHIDAAPELVQMEFTKPDEGIQTQLSGFGEKVRGLEEDNFSLKNAIESLRSEIRGLETLIKAYELKITEMKKKEDESSGLIDQLKTRIEEMSNEEENLRGQLESWDNNAVEDQEIHLVGNTLLSEIDDRRIQSETRQRSLLELHQKLIKQVQSLKRSNLDLQRRLSAECSSKKFEQLESEKKTMEYLLSDLQGKSGPQKQTVIEVSADQDALRQQLNKLLLENQALRKENQSLRIIGLNEMDKARKATFANDPFGGKTHAPAAVLPTRAPMVQDVAKVANMSGLDLPEAPDMPLQQKRQGTDQSRRAKSILRTKRIKTSENESQDDDKVNDCATQ